MHLAFRIADDLRCMVEPSKKTWQSGNSSSSIRIGRLSAAGGNRSPLHESGCATDAQLSRVHCIRTFHVRTHGSIAISNGLVTAQKEQIMSPCTAVIMSTSVTALLSFAPQAIYAQDVCEAFAKYGIYDTQAGSSDTDKASSFRTWFCQSKFESKQSADSAGLSLGYAGYELGYDSSSENWSQFSSNYCRDETYNAKYRQATRSYVQTINANASNNMLACFSRGGLHARIVPGSRQDVFYVQARLNPTGATTKATVVGFSVVGATCTGPLKSGYEISPAGVEQVCNRSSDQAVDVSLSASEQVNWDSPRGLKSVFRPAPPPPKIPIAIRAQDVARGTNVAIDQCVAGPGTLANAAPCNDAENAAEFDFIANAAGAYRMDINFAAAASRPVKVVLNGTVIRSQALSETTGSWLNSNLRWSVVGQVFLKEGSNTVRLERAGVFPHIHDLRFVPVP